MSHPPLKTANLAARVAGIATNTLATGLILILGAVGGQHALRWWSSASALATPDPLPQAIGPAAVERKQATTGAGHDPLRHLLAFGDDPLLASRSELHGDVGDALARLREDCRWLAQRVDRVRRVPGPAERQLLAQVRHAAPIESTPRWRMYQIETPLPLVVTVLDQPSVESAGDAFAPAGDASEVAEISVLESRVVSWGLAFPAVSDDHARSDRWTLFALAADSPRLDATAARRGPPVPPASRRTLSLQAESGAALVGFRGNGPVLDWKMYYDRELSGPRWTPTSVWRREGPTWQRSFTSPRDGRLDVQLSEEADGSLGGLLMSAPPADN